MKSFKDTLNKYYEDGWLIKQTHTKPIKLTGTIEYFEPADEIGIRVDRYGKFIPFFEIQSNIELIEEE